MAHPDRVHHPPVGGGRSRPGQSLVETALSLTVLLLVVTGVVEFALYAHTRQVAVSAAQEGARVASAEGRTLTEGVRQARALLDQALGPRARWFTVTPRCAAVQGDVCGAAIVGVQVAGDYPLQVIGGGALRLPIAVEVQMFMEGTGSGR